MRFKQFNLEVKFMTEYNRIIQQLIHESRVICEWSVDSGKDVHMTDRDDAGKKEWFVPIRNSTPEQAGEVPLYSTNLGYLRWGSHNFIQSHQPKFWIAAFK
jgi:hypothetical protein